MQLFSAKFQAKVDTGKTIINEAANATNTNLPTAKPPTREEEVTTVQKEKFRGMLPISELNVESFTKYSADPQKGKWGEKNLNNNRKLSAEVVSLTASKELFKVFLKVTSTNVEKPLTGKVIFYVHPTFPNSDPEIYVLQGEAKLELIAWGAFTAGAEADNKTTQLELDLAELPDAPLIFRVCS